ncbi:MAG: putative Ig domain-containing protein, partial [Armatimonadetes bacterium]|nr:putative Ig domain-containing protein [Candidatus Hippobium faecium]
VSQEYKNLCTSADPFSFTAQGVGDIAFKISKGKLPKGLTLESDGKIRGRIDSSVKPGIYKFTVTATDQKGRKDSKSFSMTVKDKPTKYIRDGRLTALIHAPEMLEGEQIEEMAKLMKRQNYTLAMPISYGNGDHTFRWPSCFEPNAENKDVVPAYKKALEENGIGFGMYIGEVIGCPQFHYQQTVLMLEDAMKQLNPKAFWFDWAGQWRPQNDQLFSALKSYNPDIVLFLNAFGTFFNGDYDMACLEDFSYGNNKTIWYWWPYERFYNDYPFNYENPKTDPIEVWKIIINPKNHPDGMGADLFNNEEIQPWKELQQLEISLIGDGAVFNFDHSPAIGFRPDAMKGKDLYYSPVMEVHKNLADWQNPEGLTPLYTSFTQVNPYKLDNTDWGYSLLSADGDKIYLHFMENRRGKKGLAYFGENDISVSPIDVPVKSVVCMNNGKSVKFSKKGKTLYIDKSQLVQDEIDTILCVNLGKKIDYAEPMSIYPLTGFDPHSEQDIHMTDVKEGKPGDLAYGKPSKLLAPDCKKECPPSAFTSYAKNAVDNDPKTVAQAAWSWAWVLETDLLEDFDVRKINLTFSENCFATDFNIEISEDRENWKKIAEIADNEQKSFSFDVTERFRYIRVRAIKPDDAGQKGLQMGITGLEIFE